MKENIKKIIDKYKENLQARLGKYYKFAVYLVIIILINLVGINLMFRIDLTSNNVYSLSKASKNAVKTLSEPLTIKVFFTKNLPAPYNGVERYLKDLLGSYSYHGNRHFNFAFYNVSAKEGDTDTGAQNNRTMAQDYGIYPVQVRQLEKDEVKFQNAYMGMVIIHGDVVEKLPSITTTDGLEYKITSSIQKMNNKISALLNLSAPIEVVLYMSSSIHVIAPYMGLSDTTLIQSKLEEVVKDVNVKNYNKLNFSTIDPSLNTNSKAEAKKYGIPNFEWQSFPDRTGKRIPAGDAFLGLIIKYKNKYESIQLLENNPLARIFGGAQYAITKIDALKDVLNNNVENILEINEKIGYMADHGTLPLQSNPGAQQMFQQRQPQDAGNLNKLLSTIYSVNEVSVKEGIPEGLECLIIAGPTEPFSEYELFQIDQFLMKGKSLALFVDSFKEFQMPQQARMYGMNQGPQYIPVTTGLEKLLTHYGVNVSASYILDQNCYEQQYPQGGKQPVFFAPVIQNKHINDDYNFMNNIKGLLIIQASPVVLNEKRIKENDLDAQVLLSSSKQSWEMQGRINLNPMYIRPPAEDQMKSLPIACLIEGEFPSYFKGKEIPLKEDDQEKANTKKAGKSKVQNINAVIEKGKQGKVIIIGSSHILKNNIIDENGNQPNAVFALNVIDYLNNKESYAVMRSKIQKFNPLDKLSPGTSTFIKSLNIVGLPVFVILFGIFIWLKRKTRQNNIKKQFQKV